LPGDLEISLHAMRIPPEAVGCIQEDDLSNRGAALQAKKEELPSPVRTLRSVRTAGVSCGLCVHVCV